MKTVYRRIFNNKGTPEKAGSIFNVSRDKLCMDYSLSKITPCQKAGYPTACRNRLEADNWPSHACNVHDLAQVVAIRWILSQDIATDLNAWSNHHTPPAITNLYACAAVIAEEISLGSHHTGDRNL